MIKQSELETVIIAQQARLMNTDSGLERDLLKELPENLGSHALIISGIRRCGKSTLLSQLIKQKPDGALFINFDTPKLYNFEIADFELLDQIIKNKNCTKLYFDEIQVIKGWELYVRQKLDEGYIVTVTGSNASLLSRELGTKLTGRHIPKELFPFSYQEYIHFKNSKPSDNTLREYLSHGGFPEYVKLSNPEILTALFDDILFRDIAVRYGIRDVKSLKQLLLFLVSNVGNLVTATKLTQALGIKSSATVLDYFSYFEMTYLLALMPKFSYSYRAQLVNPRKVYIIDSGLINAVSVSSTENQGKKLENMIYWYFRRQKKELYYFNETGFECDFVVTQNNKVEELIQVCFDLNHENRDREERGLFEAMDYFDKNNGIIITMNQQDEIRYKGKRVAIVPAYKYLTEISK